MMFLNPFKKFVSSVKSSSDDYLNLVFVKTEKGKFQIFDKDCLYIDESGDLIIDMQRAAKKKIDSEEFQK